MRKIRFFSFIISLTIALAGCSVSPSGQIELTEFTPYVEPALQDQGFSPEVRLAYLK